MSDLIWLRLTLVSILWAFASFVIFVGSKNRQIEKVAFIFVKLLSVLALLFATVTVFTE